MTWRNTVLVGDVREQLATLPDESVHMVVTSPPYWGLRDYGTAGQLGLEPQPEQYVCNMVAVFREVRRVLRKDGTVWLNLGDSYVSSPRGNKPSDHSTSSLTNPERQDTVARPRGVNSQRNGRSNSDKQLSPNHHPLDGLKPKDLVGIPWRVAFALQADGWWLRSDIIWSKPNPMPESVTDRPTRAHENLFLLSKSARYFYDAEAIREPYSPATIQRVSQPTFDRQTGGPKDYAITGEGIHSTRHALENLKQNMTRGAQVKGGDRFTGFNERWDAAEQSGDIPSAGRNKRTVWEIPTQPYADAHFATYPEALVLPCIQAGTSEHGVCSVCGAPWRRVVERTVEGFNEKEGVAQALRNAGATNGGTERVTLGVTDGVNLRTTGWEPTCKHEAPVERAVVLDPFMGSGTTGLVAKRAGRDYVGIELNPAYAEMARRRIGGQAALL